MRLGKKGAGVVASITAAAALLACLVPVALADNGGGGSGGEDDGGSGGGPTQTADVHWIYKDSWPATLDGMKTALSDAKVRLDVIYADNGGSAIRETLNGTAIIHYENSPYLPARSRTGLAHTGAAVRMPSFSSPEVRAVRFAATMNGRLQPRRSFEAHCLFLKKAKSWLSRMAVMAVMVPIWAVMRAAVSAGSCMAVRVRALACPLVHRAVV